VGYHNHQVIINRKPVSICIKSSTAHFQFSVADRCAKVMNEYAISEYQLSSTLGKPFHINGHGIISSIQTISLPDSVSVYRFAVNNHAFTLKGNNLYQGANNWYLQPNEPLIINVDLID
jgi:hypothetical protein